MDWSCHQRHTDVGSCGACAIGLDWMIRRIGFGKAFFPSWVCLIAGRAQGVTPICYGYGKGTGCHPGLLREGYMVITPRSCTYYMFWDFAIRSFRVNGTASGGVRKFD